jgi:CheY-like chemotaxis protein
MEVIWADRRAWELCRAITHGRTAKGSGRLVCGFGLPFNKDPQQSQLLILIERIGRRGLAAAQQAKEIFNLTQREDLRDIPVGVLGPCSEEAIDESFEHSADVYIAKPLDPQRLLMTMNWTQGL